MCPRLSLASRMIYVLMNTRHGWAILVVSAPLGAVAIVYERPTSLGKPTLSP